jgi:hypothetical protein
MKRETLFSELPEKLPSPYRRRIMGYILGLFGGAFF